MAKLSGLLGSTVEFYLPFESFPVIWEHKLIRINEKLSPSHWINLCVCLHLLFRICCKCIIWTPNPRELLLPHCFVAVLVIFGLLQLEMPRKKRAHCYNNERGRNRTFGFSRESITSDDQNQTNNSGYSISTCSIDNGQSNNQSDSPTDIPGFVWDPVKKRYFKVLAEPHGSCIPGGVTNSTLKLKNMESKRTELFMEQKPLVKPKKPIVKSLMSREILHKSHGHSAQLKRNFYGNNYATLKYFSLNVFCL